MIFELNGEGRKKRRERKREKGREKRKEERRRVLSVHFFFSLDFTLHAVKFVSTSVRMMTFLSVYPRILLFHLPRGFLQLFVHLVKREEV